VILVLVRLHLVAHSSLSARKKKLIFINPVWLVNFCRELRSRGLHMEADVYEAKIDSNLPHKKFKLLT